MVRSIGATLMGAMYVLAGAMHFVKPEMYLKIMPPWLPEPLLLVYLSGIAEAGFGVLVLLPRTRRIGAWGLIATLVAIFPANLHMALNPEAFADIPPIALWVRLPIQALLIWWAWKVQRVPESAR